MTPTHTLTLSDAERIRVDRVDRLVATGAAGVAELVAMMSDGSWTVRRAVVAGLAALGDDAEPQLSAWLRVVRSSEHAIAAAVDALVAATGALVTPAMIELLADPVAAVAADAAAVLGRRRAIAATPMLVRALSHVDDNVALAAIEALGTIGGVGAVDALIALVARHDFFRTFPAIQVLAATGDLRVVAPLAALLADAAYGREVVRALGRTGLAQVVRPLAAGLHGADAETARWLALAFADLVIRAEWIGSIDHVVDALRTYVGPASAQLAAALPDGDATERRAIAAVLGRIGDAAMLRPLARMLDDAEVHAAARDAIQRIGRANEDALVDTLATGEVLTRLAILPLLRTSRAAPAARALLGDDDAETRARACEALARIGDVAAVPALFGALADASPRVAHAATAAIQALGIAETPARTIDALRTGSNAVRRHALRIVACMGFDSAFDPVRTAIADADPRIAELAVAALAALGDVRVDTALATFSEDPRDGVRAATMRAAAHRGGAPAVRLLRRGLGDRAAWVRYYACQGIGRIGGGDATALVIARLADPEPHVQIAAIEALGHLDTPAAWAALCSAAASDDPDRHRAALASMSLRPRDHALAFLLAGVGATDIATRLIALQGLARRAEPAAVRALASAVRSENADVRDAALSLLADHADPAAATELVELALALPPDHPVHLALSRAADPRADAIAARLQHADEAAAFTLVGALARMRSDHATALLFDALARDNAHVRRVTAAALAAVGTAATRASLTRLTVDDPDGEVRRISAAASADSA